MNTKRSLIAFTFVAASVGVSMAQVPAPAAPQSRPILIQGATLHTVTGPVLENSSLLFTDGKFVSVGEIKETLPDTITIDMTGKHIYPGLFEAHSSLGLTEIQSISATNDFQETGAMNPNVSASVALNAESDVIAVTRSNGVLLAISAPSGGLVSGKAAAIQLEGWTSEDMTLSDSAGLVVNWPSSSRGRRRRTEPTDNTNSGIERLKKLFDDARAYRALRQDASADQRLDLRLESMADVLAGIVPLYVRADSLVDIQAAVGFAIEQKCKLIILGGYDAPHCAELLKKNNVPVVISAVYRMPQRANEPEDYAYTLPARLHKAGIRFCISSTDRSETWNTRNLPYHAGTAIAFGLPAEEALKAVTIYPAMIFGLGDKLGSLDAGKDATFIVTDGDPLDTRTQVLGAYVQGRNVDLSNRQTQLYEKYQQKYTQPGHIPPNRQP